MDTRIILRGKVMGSSTIREGSRRDGVPHPATASNASAISARSTTGRPPGQGRQQAGAVLGRSPGESHEPGSPNEAQSRIRMRCSTSKRRRSSEASGCPAPAPTLASTNTLSLGTNGYPL